MKHFYKISIGLLLIVSTLFAQNHLRILDPMNPWENGQGTIEEAVLEITPYGNFFKHELYLTFSAEELFFNEQTNLEIEYYFELPEDVTVTDLWLWVGDEISKAFILDTYTANNTYEGIVQRRRDPAILFKRQAGVFELRIYPLLVGETRKVKLEYLVPAVWSKNYISTGVPTDLLKTSSRELEHLECRVNSNSKFGTPLILGDPARQFDLAIPDQYTISLSAADMKEPLHVGFESPMVRGVFVSQFPLGSNGYYQFAFLPSLAFNIEMNKKLLFILDYDMFNSNINRSSLLSNLYGSMQINFNEADSFNILISGLESRMLSETWLQATESIITETLDNVQPADIPVYSNMTTALNDGIKFMNENNSGGTICLITDSDQVESIEAANEIINFLKSRMKNEIRINIVDYCNTGAQYDYYLNEQYYGSQYFFETLCRTTGGIYLNIREDDTNIRVLMNEAIGSAEGVLATFDLYTTLENGYCHARLDDYELNGSISINKAITQIGKYTGEFPFKAQLNSTLNGEYFGKEIVYSNEDVFEVDSTLKTYWTGTYLNNLQGKYPSYENVSDIMLSGIENRILTFYTSFLALEPGDSVNVCLDCIDNGWIPTSVDEEIQTPATFELTAYPNPFNSQVRIKANIPAQTDVSKISFKIFNILGQLVKSFDNINTEPGATLELLWDGKDENSAMVTSGVYLFVMTTPSQNYTLKLMYVK